MEVKSLMQLEMKYHNQEGERMSEVAISVRKAVPIIVVTWILSLITTLLFVYADPSLFQLQFSQKEHQTEIIRFYEPYEKNVTGTGWMTKLDLAVFVWTPSNSTNNAILEVYAHAEYYYENPPQITWQYAGRHVWWMDFFVSVNEIEYTLGKILTTAQNQTEWEQESYKWKQTCLFKARTTKECWIEPNQSNYTLAFQLAHSDNADEVTPTYLRNINVIIKVIDGIPVT